MPRLYPMPGPAKGSPPTGLSKALPASQAKPEARLAGRKPLPLSPTPSKGPEAVSPEPPQDGWWLRRWEDLGADPAFWIRCDNKCGHRLRYVHFLNHHDWPGCIKVGCCCAAKLSSDYDPTEYERRMISLAKREQLFVTSPRWRVSKKGNPWLKAGKRIVTIFSKGPWWFACIAKKGEPQPSWGNDFLSIEAAKRWAFRRLEELKEEGQSS